MRNRETRINLKNTRSAYHSLYYDLVIDRKYITIYKYDPCRKIIIIGVMYSYLHNKYYQKEHIILTSTL